MLRLTLVPSPYTHPQGSELLLGQEADSPQETLCAPWGFRWLTVLVAQGFGGSWDTELQVEEAAAAGQ